jgi:alkylation response protein AidB-like acyl-CoA dehydrogenase
MELTSLTVPEEQGGAGASFVEVGIVLEELGRSLLPVPYLPTAVAAALLPATWLERIVAGAVVGLALPAGTGARLPDARAVNGGLELHGTIDHVIGGESAELLVVAAVHEGALGLFVVDADATTIEPRATLDQTRRQASVTFNGERATLLDCEVERALDLTRVALALESVGAAARCLEMTVDYLKERVQFGRALGTFQALRHRCADLAAELEAATSTAYYAAAAPDELEVLGPLAGAVCAEAFLHVAAETIQLHGGIGFTWEHDAHLYFKRAKSTELLFGTPRELRRLAAARAGVIAT